MIINEKYINSLNENEIILSINTTGINRHKNKIFLINIITGGSNGEIIQILVDNKDQAEDIFLFNNLIKGKIIINFNGDSFDFPFLNYYLNKEKYIAISNESFDIYKFFKNFNFLYLQSYDLKNIFEIFTNNNYQLMDSKVNISTYKNYLFNGDKSKLETILYQGKLSVLYRYKIFTSIKEFINKASIDFDIFDTKYKATPYEYKIKKDFINIKLLNLSKNKTELNLNLDYFNMNSDDKFFYLKYKLITGYIEKDNFATCVIYPDIFNIHEKYRNINDNIIPIFMNDKINKEYILGIINDSLINLKNYA